MEFNSMKVFVLTSGESSTEFEISAVTGAVIGRDDHHSIPNALPPNFRKFILDST
jgi:hypothetical protein